MKYKLNVLLMTSLALLLASCQSQMTKNELCGKWAYSGSAHAVVFVFFHKNNTYEYKALSRGWFSTEGVYTIRGKNITLTSKEGDIGVLRVYDESTLYASDGSKYVKVEDY